MTIASEITRINTNIENAYTACNGKGATMPVTQNSANLATCIGSIQTGSTPTLITKNITQNGTYNASSDNADGYSSVTVNVSGGGGWQPDPDWWDIKTILQNDTRDYYGKAILLYSNSDDFTEFTIRGYIRAVATSDGAFYEIPLSSVTHTWDRTKDKIVSGDTSDTTPKYGTRYIILYFDTTTVLYTELTPFRTGCIYAVFKCNPGSSTTSFTQNTFFRGNRWLQSFDFLTGHYIIFSGKSASYFCTDCTSLQKLPDNLNVSPIRDFSNFCSNCRALQKLPDNLDVSSGTNFSSFCANCNSLVEFPDVLDVSNATGFPIASMYALVKANIKLPTPSSSYTLNISNSTVISIQSLQYIADNAPTVSGITAKITLGNTNITRAGGASGSVVTTLTNKGWTVN